MKQRFRGAKYSLWNYWKNKRNGRIPYLKVIDHLQAMGHQGFYPEMLWHFLPRQHSNVSTVLGPVAKSGITLFPEKGHIAYQSIKALGHPVGNLGIGTTRRNGSLRKGISHTPQRQITSTLPRLSCLPPKIRQSLRSTSCPSLQLLQKDVPYKWTPEQEDSMNALKTALT